jgi:predicted glutamine amidotransferase
MCRLILAHGQFDPQSVLEAAVDMSQGRTAEHDGPTTIHPNGWGAVWRAPGPDKMLRVFRSREPLCMNSIRRSPIWSARTDLLAIHARHATLPSHTGIEFAHPLTRHGASEGSTWHFMHNGYTPTIYTLLGKDKSDFDSADYFEYLVDAELERLDRNASLKKLAAVPPGNSAGNAIAINARYAYVIHYAFPGRPYNSYFQMYKLQLPGHVIYSSEALPQLASRLHWDSLRSRDIFEIRIS